MPWENLSKRLREEHLLRDCWHVYSVSCDPEETPEGMIRVMGCEFAPYVRGPKIGQPKIFGGKVDQATRKVFFLPVDALQQG